MYDLGKSHDFHVQIRRKAGGIRYTTHNCTPIRIDGAKIKVVRVLANINLEKNDGAHTYMRCPFACRDGFDNNFNGKSDYEECVSPNGKVEPQKINQCPVGFQKITINRDSVRDKESPNLIDKAIRISRQIGGSRARFPFPVTNIEYEDKSGLPVGAMETCLPTDSSDTYYLEGIFVWGTSKFSEVYRNKCSLDSPGTGSTYPIMRMISKNELSWLQDPNLQVIISQPNEFSNSTPIPAFGSCE